MFDYVGYKLLSEEVKIAQSNNIPISIVKNRINNLGWDIERAITEPVNKNGNFSKLYTTEQKEIAESNGISPQLLYKRLKLKWHMEDAINIPPHTARRFYNGN